MPKKKLTAAEMAAVRIKFKKSALGRRAHLTPRDSEVINNPDSFRILIYDHRLEGGRWEGTVKTGIEAHRVLQQITGVARKRTLVYAVKGTRDALIPESRYDELFLYPAN